MIFILWIAVLASALMLIAQMITLLHVKKLRRDGIYPQAGQATMDDVLRLAKAGSTVWALRCYREIHNCSLYEAKTAVAKLLANS